MSNNTTSHHSDGLGVGIDFGTSSIRIAICDPLTAKPQLLTFDGEESIPAFVGFTDTGRVFGKEAVAQRIQNSKNTVFDVLLLLGVPYGAYLAGRYPYNMVAKAQMINGTVYTMQTAIRVSERGTMRDYSLLEILGMLFSYLRSEVARTSAARNVKPDRVVVTVPAFFRLCDRKIIQQAAEVGGWENVVCVASTTAAATGYLFTKKPMCISVYRALFLDVGAGFSSVGIISTVDGKHKLESSCGARFGSADPTGRNLTELLRGLIFDALKFGRLGPSEIDEVVLLGQRTRNPAVKACLLQDNLFPSCTMSRHGRDHVAREAAYRAAAPTTDPICLRDCISGQNVQIRGIDKYGRFGSVESINVGTLLPARLQFVRRTMSSSVLFTVTEANRYDSRQFDELAQIIVENIPQIDTGQAHLTLTYHINSSLDSLAEGLESRSNRTLKVVTTSTGGYSVQFIEKAKMRQLLWNFIQDQTDGLLVKIPGSRRYQVDARRKVDAMLGKAMDWLCKEDSSSTADVETYYNRLQRNVYNFLAHYECYGGIRVKPMPENFDCDRISAETAHMDQTGQFGDDGIRVNPVDYSQFHATVEDYESPELEVPQIATDGGRPPVEGILELVSEGARSATFGTNISNSDSLDSMRVQRPLSPGYSSLPGLTDGWSSRPSHIGIKTPASSGFSMHGDASSTSPSDSKQLASSEEIYTFFADGPRQLSESDFSKLSMLLHAAGETRLANVPRLYAIVRWSGLPISKVFHLLNLGYDDRILPFVKDQLPGALTGCWEDVGRVQEIVFNRQRR